MPKENDIQIAKQFVETGFLTEVLRLIEQRLKKLESKPQETPVSSSEDDIDCSWYVVVTEKDGDENYAQISVRETFLRDSDLESAKLRVERYKEIGCYGNCRIARLVFPDEEKETFSMKKINQEAIAKANYNALKEENAGLLKCIKKLEADKGFKARNEKRPEVL